MTSTCQLLCGSGECTAATCGGTTMDSGMRKCSPSNPNCSCPDCRKCSAVRGIIPRTCECPPGQTGYFQNPEIPGGICVCRPGYHDPGNGTCVYSCTDPFVPNSTNDGCIYGCTGSSTPNASNTGCDCLLGLVTNGIVCTCPGTSTQHTKNGNTMCCPPDHVPNAGGTGCESKVTCNLPQTWDADTNSCVCPPGYEKDGINCNIICLPNSTRTSENTCVCDTGVATGQSACTCPSEFNNVGDISNIICCAPGFSWNGTQCVPIPPPTPVCNFPLILNPARTSCVCAPGYTWNDALQKCVFDCVKPLVVNSGNNGCECTGAYHEVDGTCTYRCDFPLAVNSSNNGCECRGKYHEVDGTCTYMCQRPQIVNSSNDACICEPGYTWDVARGKCIINCDLPLVPNSNGDKCECIGKYHEVDGTCTYICQDPLVVNSKNDGCDCKGKYHDVNGRCTYLCEYPQIVNSTNDGCMNCTCPSDCKYGCDTNCRECNPAPLPPPPAGPCVCPSQCKNGCSSDCQSCNDSGLPPWVIPVVATLGGLIVLGIGFYAYRRTTKKKIASSRPTLPEQASDFVMNSNPMLAPKPFSTRKPDPSSEASGIEMTSNPMLTPKPFPSPFEMGPRRPLRGLPKRTPRKPLSNLSGWQCKKSEKNQEVYWEKNGVRTSVKPQGAPDCPTTATMTMSNNPLFQRVSREPPPPPPINQADPEPEKWECKLSRRTGKVYWKKGNKTTWDKPEDAPDCLDIDNGAGTGLRPISPGNRASRSQGLVTGQASDPNTSVGKVSVLDGNVMDRVAQVEKGDFGKRETKKNAVSVTGRPSIAEMVQGIEEEIAQGMEEDDIFAYGKKPSIDERTPTVSNNSPALRAPLETPTRFDLPPQPLPIEETAETMTFYDNPLASGARSQTRTRFDLPPQPLPIDTTETKTFFGNPLRFLFG